MRYAVRVGIVATALVLSGCGTPRAVRAPEPEVIVVESQSRRAPGVVEYVWEEPMVDVVDVPPGLDPEGTYYRQGHQAVIEVRQGRWRYYKHE